MSVFREKGILRALFRSENAKSVIQSPRVFGKQLFPGFGCRKVCPPHFDLRAGFFGPILKMRGWVGGGSPPERRLPPVQKNNFFYYPQSLIHTPHQELRPASLRSGDPFRLGIRIVPSDPDPVLVVPGLSCRAEPPSRSGLGTASGARGSFGFRPSGSPWSLFSSPLFDVSP